MHSAISVFLLGESHKIFSELRTMKIHFLLQEILSLQILPVLWQPACHAVWLIASGHLNSADSFKNYLSAVSTLCKMFGTTCHTPTTYREFE
jgi:hypothetical protein